MISIFAMEKELIETVLKRCAQNTAIKKVLEVTHEPALNKGENYMSDIIRIRAQVMLGCGRILKKSFIIKKQLEISVMNEMFKSYDLFKTEAMIYTVIMKEMEYLMEEFEDTEDVMWCKLYEHGPTFLFLEDLKASGFMLANRQKGLGIEEGQLVLHNLARFHAMSKVLEVRGIFKKDMLQPFICTRDRALTKGIIHSGLVTFSKAIKESWGPSWEMIGDRINIPYEYMIERFTELSQVNATKFNVLNHGDVWPNNIMFKYNWQNKPMALRLLDFQLCHYNSCCWDLVFFLFYAMAPSIRRTNLSALVQFYQTSLINALDKYGYTGKGPTVDELDAEIDRLSFWGYCLLFSEYPPLVTDLMDGYEMEQVISNSSEGGGYSIDVYKDKRLIEKIGPDLVQFVKKYKF